MVELKLNIEENIIQTIGQKSLEQQIQAFLQKLILKNAAKDILSDLNDYDFVNDPQWEIARTLAWKEDKHNYLVSIQ